MMAQEYSTSVPGITEATRDHSMTMASLYLSQAPAAGHFVIGYEHFLEELNGFTPRISYASQLSMLTASDDTGNGKYGGKYLAFHSLHADIFPWFRARLY